MKIVVTSRIDPTISTSCTVDFVKRIVGVRATLDAVLMDDNTHRTIVVGDDDTYTFDGVRKFNWTGAEVVYTAGTIANTEQFTYTMDFCGTDEFVSAMRSLTMEDMGIESMDDYPFPYYLEQYVGENGIIIRSDKHLTAFNTDFTNYLNVVYVDWVGDRNSLWHSNGYDQNRELAVQPYFLNGVPDVFRFAALNNISVPVWRIVLTAASSTNTYTTTVECFGTAAQFPLNSVTSISLDRFSVQI